MAKPFPSSLESLYEMLNYISINAKEIGFDGHYIKKIELACEEALVNIINHTFKDKSGTIDIECIPTEKKRGIKVIFKDKGKAFDPTEKMNKLLSEDSIKKPQDLGGFGLFFIFNLMDEVHYRREGDYNKLIMIKYFS